jgi:RimJ/RimL family protein N-acetyltransferase
MTTALKLTPADPPVPERAPIGPSLLSGGRVHLRPMFESDIEEVYRRHLDVASRGKYFPLTVRSRTSLEAMVAKDGRWGDDAGLMMVVQNGDEALVGYVGFERIVGDVDEINLGYFTYPEFRGQGYASEATRLFVEYLFAMRRDMNRAALYIHPDNANSIHLAERCGFSYEGRIREGWFNLGQWHDLIVYGLLRRELVDGKPVRRM